MLVKYIVALLALTPQPYIQLAKTHFSSSGQQYILGEGSQPHITIVQFMASPDTYQKIALYLKGLSSAQPFFTGFSFVKDKTHKDIWWAELSAARNEDILTLNTAAVHILKKHGVTPLNDVGNLYRPHLTLARVNKATIVDLPADILQTDSFKLVVGKADPLGQFVEVIEEL